MRLSPIVDRLKEKGRRRVYGALELAGLSKVPAQLPADFVVPQDWGAEPNRLTGIHDQRVSETFGVVILVQGRALDDNRISDELQEHEAAVIDALAGWTHPDAEKACDALAGRLLFVDGTTLAWIVTFRTGHRIRKAAS